MAGDVDDFCLHAPQVEYLAVLQGEKMAFLGDRRQKVFGCQDSPRQLGGGVAHPAFQGLLPKSGNVRRVDINLGEGRRPAGVIRVHMGQQHLQRLTCQSVYRFPKPHKARARVHQQRFLFPLHKKQEYPAGVLDLGDVRGDFFRSVFVHMDYRAFLFYVVSRDRASGSSSRKVSR